MVFFPFILLDNCVACPTQFLAFLVCLCQAHVIHGYDISNGMCILLRYDSCKRSTPLTFSQIIPKFFSSNFLSSYPIDNPTKQITECILTACSSLFNYLMCYCVISVFPQSIVSENLIWLSYPISSVEDKKYAGNLSIPQLFLNHMPIQDLSDCSFSIMQILYVSVYNKCHCSTMVASVGKRSRDSIPACIGYSPLFLFSTKCTKKKEEAYF